MSNEVKRYDPINSDGTCGMCIEDADYGAYVEYTDYAALEAELATVKKVAYGNMELLDENRNLQAELAKLRAGQEPVRFWFIGDAGQQKGATYCKKSSRDGSLAFFECEEDAKRAALRHPGTEVYPVEYYHKPQATPQPSAGVVMPERYLPARYGDYYAPGWNACLDEFARLNGKEVGRG